MNTRSKITVFVSWLISFCGQTLTGISWHCPSKDMVSSDYGCYLLHAEPLSFDEAQSHCWSVDADLVWVESQDELMYIASQALQAPQVESWLLGMHSLSDQKDLSTYYWTSGNKVSYTAWCDTEPDRYRNEKCVTAELKCGYRWATVPCHERRSFICKTDPPFFRLKNPFLLGALGVVLILLIILVFVLCTMRRNSSTECDDHMYCTRKGVGCNDNNDMFILDHMPSAPPADDRYTTLPPSYNDVAQVHIYEDVKDVNEQSRRRDNLKPSTRGSYGYACKNLPS